MLFSNIEILDEHLQHRTGMYVGVQGNRIAYIGETKPQEDYGTVYHGAGRLLMTGFFNMHSHAAMTLLRGYAENKTLWDWLSGSVFPFEAQMRGEDVYAGNMLAFAEMLRCGTVSISDMYVSQTCEEMHRAVMDSGIKCNFCLGTSGSGEEQLEDQLAYQKGKLLYETAHGDGDGRYRLDVGLHAEYTSTPRIVAQVAQLAKETGLIVQVHLSETKNEHEQCKERHGMTPAQYFAHHGLFENPTVAAHCVWLEPEDMDILAKHNVTVAACPVSNLKLASGFCSVPELLRRGINVTLGTDGAASNNNLNIMEEIKLFATLYKGVTGDPTVVTPQDTLRAATINGARAQGRTDCGSLKVGNRADLVVLDLDTPAMHPVHNMLNNVVFAAQGGDVRLTMVDGRVLYKEGEYLTIDLPKIRHDAQASTNAILSRI